MEILRRILDSLPTEKIKVSTVQVGAHWTLVGSRGWGLASTLLPDEPHGSSSVRDVGMLHQKDAQELASWSLSSHVLEASIGMAALNSLLDVDETQAVMGDALDILTKQGANKRVAIVGHFPFIPKLKPICKEVWVIEQKPTMDEIDSKNAAGILSQADLAVITGTTLINHTFDQLLYYCKKDAFVMVLGPSTPLSPVLFDYGVMMISGVRVVSPQEALITVQQGAIFPQIKGVRRLTLMKEKV